MIHSYPDGAWCFPEPEKRDPAASAHASMRKKINNSWYVSFFFLYLLEIIWMLFFTFWSRFTHICPIFFWLYQPMTSSWGGDDPNHPAQTVKPQLGFSVVDGFPMNRPIPSSIVPMVIVISIYGSLGHHPKNMSCFLYAVGLILCYDWCPLRFYQEYIL